MREVVGREVLHVRVENGALSLTQVRIEKGEESAENGNCVELGFDPDHPGRLLLGDSKQANGGRILSVDPEVAHVLFTGMQDSKDGRPGRFTYEGLRMSKEGQPTITAESLETIADEDLVVYLDVGEVLVGTHESGPVFQYTRAEWEVFASGVTDPNSNLNQYVYWVASEAAYQTRAAA
jgi:hypothetical protein